MISKFFIERPVLANVLAILMVVIGAVALFSLPVAQYPDVVPPTVQVTTRYPGASARTVIDTVALPIEQQVNGVEGMIYMQSYAAADGTYTLTVTFNIGTDLNFAQVLVQNRVSAALAQLPTAVQEQGVTVQKKSTAILQIVTLTSSGRALRQPLSQQLRHHPSAATRSRALPGVGNVNVFGAGQYSMRIWLDPEQDAGARARRRRMSSTRCSSRTSRSRPARSACRRRRPTRRFNTRSNVLSRLDDAEQFADVIVKTGTDRRDHARPRHRPRRARRADLQPALQSGRQAAAGIAIFQSPGANALDVGNEVKKPRWPCWRRSFRKGCSLRHPVRHDDVRLRSRSTRSTRRCTRPRSWC